MELTSEERERRSLAMRELNASGRRGRRRRRTDDERIRESLMRIIATGTPRQRLDATRELVALDERSPGRPGRDFDRMTDAEIARHFEAMVGRAVDHWASERLVPQFRELFDGTALDGIVDRVVKRKLAERA